MLRITNSPSAQKLAQVRDLLARQQLPSAESLLREILTSEPANPTALHLLGTLAYRAGKIEQSILILRQALACESANADIWNDLGSVYSGLGRLDDATDCFRQVVTHAPAFVDGWYNLGLSLFNSGLIEESLAFFKKALALRPDFPEAHAIYLYALNFLPAATPEFILAEHRQWDFTQARPLAALTPAHNNERTPTRPLRIGFVSPYFNDHCQSYFTIPLLSHLNRDAFHITLYSDVFTPDAITSRLQTHANTYRSILGMPDNQVADLIRRDQIDILVDLTMHMHGSRLPIFARRPAPIQFAWLAYPGTTGLSTIDYRLTDPYLDPLVPPGIDAHYSEKSIRLPDTFWCYDPLSDIQISRTEASARPLTFGCLNNFCKISEETLCLWAKVLTAVPASRLLLLAPEGRHRERILSTLRRQNIAPSRVEFVPRLPRPQYLQLYNQIDISLDTLPYNGHTTSLDSLWMGVPVVTLVGRTIVGRAGISQLTNLNLPDLIAHTPEQFIAITTTLANDRPRLHQLHATLRPCLEASPLMNAPRFAQAVESALKTAWQNYCKT